MGGFGVRSRHEKSVQTILDAKGYRTSVPLVRCFHKRSSGSAWDSQKPLIVGYVFAVQDRENPFRIVTTPGFVETLVSGANPASYSRRRLKPWSALPLPGSPWPVAATTGLARRWN